MFGTMEVGGWVMVVGVSLYVEVQGIMGNGHIGTILTDRMTDRHDWKHYLSATSLVGSKYLLSATKLRR